MPRVYASLPLSGPERLLGREILRGADRALERAEEGSPELIVLDTGGEGRDARAVDAARLAADDDEAVAYLGDFHSSQVAATAPILGAAGLLQVAPVATWVELEGPTLVCLMPNDRVGAGAIADWLADAEVSELLVVHDHDPDYGVAVGRMCTAAARERGIEARSRPIWDHDEEWVADVADAGAVLYVGVAGSGAIRLWADLHRARPDMWLLGTEGVAVAWLAEAIGPSAAERTRFFVAPTRPFGSYGEEGMSLILEAVAEGGANREAVVRAAKARHIPTTDFGCLAVVDGQLVSV